MASREKPLVDLTARCACGRVTLAVVGRIHSMFLCSCEDCQRATGTGHSTVALAETGNVTVTGQTASFSRPANSGATLTRWFCPNCGTPLHAQSSRAGALVILPVGLFGANSDWFVPNQLIFARSHRDWDVVDDTLPRHATYRDVGAH